MTCDVCQRRRGRADKWRLGGSERPKLVIHTQSLSPLRRTRVGEFCHPRTSRGGVHRSADPAGRERRGAAPSQHGRKRSMARANCRGRLSRHPVRRGADAPSCGVDRAPLFDGRLRARTGYRPPDRDRKSVVWVWHASRSVAEASAASVLDQLTRQRHVPPDRSSRHGYRERPDPWAVAPAERRRCAYTPDTAIHPGCRA